MLFKKTQHSNLLIGLASVFLAFTLVPVATANSATELTTSLAKTSSNHFQNTPDKAFVRVQEGSTLWRLAAENLPANNATQWQMVMSLYRLNPQAFANQDINLLFAGSKLRLPTLTQLHQLTNKQAEAAYYGLKPVKSALAVAAPKTALSQQAVKADVVTTEAPSDITPDSQPTIDPTIKLKEELKTEPKLMPQTEVVAQVDLVALEKARRLEFESKLLNEQAQQRVKFQKQALKQQTVLSTLADQALNLEELYGNLKLEQKQVVDQQQAISQNNEQLVQSNEKLAKVLANHDEKLSRLDEKTSDIEAGVMALDEKSAQIQAEVIALDEKGAQIQGGIEALDEKSAQMHTGIEALDEKSAQIQTGVEALDEKSAQLQTGVTALDEKSGQIQARVMALDEKSGHIATEVLGLNEQSAEIATNVEVLRESVSVTQAKLSLAQQDLAQAEAALASSKQELQRVYETQLTYNQAQALQVQKWVAIGKQVAIVAGLAMLLVLLVWLFVTGLKRTAHKSTPAKMAHKPATVGQGPRRKNKPVDASEGPESNDAQNGVDQENGSSKEELSFQVGSILKGETIPNNKNDEPLDYLSHEEDMTTKLFLASSYKDMGELSKARKILTEVGSKGNPEQQEQAQQMLASLDKA